MKWTFVLVLTLCRIGVAQDWELGGGGGYGIYRNGTIIAPAGTATAGIRNRFVATAYLGEDLHQHVSGEFRYVYHDGDPFLEAGGVKVNVQGQSHTFTYDLLLHLRGRRASVRPYAAIGIGVKQYVVTGPANPVQPLQSIGFLRETDEVKFVTSAGGGVSLAVGSHVDVRLDFRDYIMTFPKKILVPVSLATGRGIFHQFTPMIGIGFRF